MRSGCDVDSGCDLLPRKLGVASDEFAVACAQGLAAAGDIVEKQGHFARDFHLGVETGAFEFLRTIEQRFSERKGIVESAQKDRGNQAMETNVERIDENDSAACEQARHEPAESRAEGFARRIGFVQRTRNFVGARALQGLSGSADERLDGFAKRDFAHALADIFVASGQVVARQAVARHPGRVIHLGEVVVLGGEPEDGHGIDAAARGFFRDAHRGDRFIKGVRWAGEKPYLLARDDRNRAGSQPIEISRGSGIDFVLRREARVLFAQHVDHGFPHARIEANFTRGCIDACSGWRMRVIF